MNNFLNNIKKIKSNNIAIDFLVHRFQLNKYRGMHIFQHSRFDDNELYIIIKCAFETLEKFKINYIEVPSGDENNGKNNGYYLSDFPVFEFFIDKIRKTTGKHTSMTIRKNVFPDLFRANILIKYDKNYNVTHKSKYKYFSISEEILNLNKIDLYNRFITNIMGDIIDDLYYVLKEIKKIEKNEFMLFFTWINCEKNFDKNKIIELINAWRELTKPQRFSVIENLKKYMNPLIYKNIKKNLKKDWGNLRNETQQIFSCLKNARILNVTTDEICLNLEKNDKNKFQIIRNVKIYEDYHKNNKTTKTVGFEMDHIVKFSFSTKPEDITLIDNWQNLIYIDGKTHSIKTQLNSKHMKLSKNVQGLKLVDITNIEPDINLVFNENVLINTELVDAYIEYNDYLLNKIVC